MLRARGRRGRGWSTNYNIPREEGSVCEVCARPKASPPSHPFLASSIRKHTIDRPPPISPCYQIFMLVSLGHALSLCPLCADRCWDFSESRFSHRRTSSSCIAVVFFPNSIQLAALSGSLSIFLVSRDLCNYSIRRRQDAK